MYSTGKEGVGEIRVCMVGYLEFPRDTRMRREVSALMENGFTVDVICISEEGEPVTDSWEGSNIHRLRIGKRRGGFLRYLFNYPYFTVYCLLKLLKLNWKKRYDFIQVNNPPNFLVLSALPLKFFFNTKIVLDIRDPMPEFIATKFSLSMSSPFIRFVDYIEVFFAKMFDSVITVNEIIQEDLQYNGVESCVVMNSTPLEEKNFKPVEKDGFKIVVASIVVSPRDFKTIMDAVKIVKERIPDVRLEIVGGGDMLGSLKENASSEGISEFVRFYGWREHEFALERIAGSDACYIPLGKLPLYDISTPHKLFEYAAYGKPMIVPRLRGLQSMLKEDECYFFTPGNVQEVANILVRIHDDPVKAAEVGEKASRLTGEYNWDLMKKRFIDCYREQ